MLADHRDCLFSGVETVYSLVFTFYISKVGIIFEVTVAYLLVVLHIKMMEVLVWKCTCVCYDFQGYEEMAVTGLRLFFYAPQSKVYFPKRCSLQYSSYIRVVCE